MNKQRRNELSHVIALIEEVKETLEALKAGQYAGELARLNTV